MFEALARARLLDLPQRQRLISQLSFHSHPDKYFNSTDYNLNYE